MENPFKYSKVLREDITRDALGGDSLPLLDLDGFPFKEDFRRYFESGREYLKEKRYEEALECFDKCLDLENESLEAWKGKGDCLKMMNQYEQVLVVLKKILELNHKRFSKLLELGKFQEGTDLLKSAKQTYYFDTGLAFYYMKNFGSAIENFDKVHELIDGDDDLSLVCWYLKGSSFDSLEKYEEAITCFDQVNRFGGYSNIWLRKGFCFNRMDRHEEALHCYDETIAIDERSVVAWKMKGTVLKMEKRYEEALKCFNRLIEIEESDEYWFEKGEIMNEMGKYEDSLHCYKKAIAINPKNSDAWLNLAVSLLEVQQNTEAIYCFDKFIELNDIEKIDKMKCDLIFAGKARSYKNLGCYKEAIECLDKLISIDSDDTTIYNNKGFCLVQLGRYEEALQCFKESIKGDENDYIGYNNIGNALIDMGREKEAIEYFTKSIELSKDKDAMACKLGLLYKFKQYEEAIECANSIIDIDKEIMEVWNIKGMSLMFLGRYEEAIKCFDEILTTENLNLGTLYNKSFCLSQVGRYEESISCLKKRLEAESSDKGEDWYNIAFLLGLIGKYEEALESLDNSLKESPDFECSTLLKAFFLDILGEDVTNIEQCWNNCSSNKFQWINLMKQQWKGQCGPFFNQLMEKNFE